MAEYPSDVGVLLEALDTARRERPGIEVVWYETMPQHWPPYGPFDPDVSYDGGTCLQEPPRGAALRQALLNASEVARRAAARQALLATRALQSYQNSVVRPMLARFRVPLVPLWWALASRGHLHARSLEGVADCTHWCEHSEVTLHMAKAVLAVLAV